VKNVTDFITDAQIRKAE